MKRLQGRWVFGIALVFMIAATMWFAAPTIAAITQPTVVLVSGGGVPVYQEHGTLAIEKRDINTHNIVNLPGVKFQISPNPYTRVSGSSLAVQDNVVVNVNYDINPNNGYIKLQNVLTGIYTIVEIGAPAGYSIDPTVYTINITSGNTTTFVSNDRPFNGIIMIEKRDINTNDIIDLPGVTFLISPNPYTFVTGSTLVVQDNVVVPPGNYDLDARNGYIKMQNVLTGSYTVVEISAPAGYSVDPTVYTLNVTSNQIATFVSRDRPFTGIPASSNTTLWIMIAIFGALICGFILWRSRRTQISHP